MKPPGQKSLWKKLIGVLSSVKLTVAILITTAAVSITGTLLPQGNDAGNLSTRLFLDDIFHSAWFSALGFLLCINTALCTAKRFPGAIARLKKNNRLAGGRKFEIKNDADIPQLVSEMEILISRTHKTRTTRSDSSIDIIGQKGEYRRLWMAAMHASVIVIMAGMWIGGLGFDGFVEMRENESTESIFIDNGKKSIDLGFTVRCDAFDIEFYDNRTPSEYKSELAFLEDGQVIKKSSVIVNHPARFRGMRFYQASYRPLSRCRIRIFDGKSDTFISRPARSAFPLPNDTGTVHVLRIEENFMNMGPAVDLWIKTEDGDSRIWVFKNIEMILKAHPDLVERFPRFDAAIVQPLVFYLENLDTVYKTGLMVNKDPGVPIVAAGSIIFITALMFTLLSHEGRISVTIDTKRKKPLVRISQTTDRSSRQDFREMDLADIANKFEEQ